MKYLITGGAGFLGSNLSKKALDNGESVIIIDNLSRKGSEENLKWLSEYGKINFYKVDIRDADKVRQIIIDNKPEIVFHLAGQVAMTNSLQDPIKDFEINVLGTLNLLESTRRYSHDSVVLYSSSNKVYGDLKKYIYRESSTRFINVEFPNGFNEEIPLEFSTPYGCSKGAADQYVIDYFKTFGLRTVSFRHSSMYGGRQFSTYDQGWIGWFVQKAIEQKYGNPDKFSISGSGKQVRDILHVDDVVELYFEAVSNIENIVGNAFNIGGGIENSISIIELLSLLEKQFDISLKFYNIPERLNDQRVFIADYTKAKKLIGWHPTISMNHGILKMIEWTKDELKS